MLAASIMRHAKMNLRWNTQDFKLFYEESHGYIFPINFVAQIFPYKMRKNFFFVKIFRF